MRPGSGTGILRRKAGLWLALVLAALLGGEAPARGQELPFRRRRGDIAVLTDVGASYANELLHDAKSFRAAFARYLPYDPAGIEHGLRVVVFAEKEDFDAYNERVHGADETFPSFVYHHYTRNDPRNEVAAFRVQGSAMRRCLCHEAFHHFLHQFIDHPPMWLDEGLAEFFEAGDFDQYGNWSPGPHRQYARFLREAVFGFEEGFLTGKFSPIPVRALVQLGREEWLASRETNYALSWGFCDFLLRCGKEGLRECLDRSLAALEPGVPAEQNLERVFRKGFAGVDWEQLEDAFREYIAGLLLPGWEAWQRGRVALEEGKAEEALAAFEQALRKDTLNELYHVGRGEALLRLERFREAEQAARRALNLNSEEAAGPFLMGRILYEQDRTGEARVFFRRAAKTSRAYEGEVATWLEKIGQERR